jgi:hypothetical protein
MADNSGLYLRAIAEWRAVLEAVRATRCEVVAIPVIDLQMILDCCDPAWIVRSENGVRALAVPVHPTTSEAAPVAPGAAPDPTKEIHS